PRPSMWSRRWRPCGVVARGRARRTTAAWRDTPARRPKSSSKRLRTTLPHGCPRSVRQCSPQATEDTRAAVVDELGDVFYQVLFHSALLDESGGHDYGHSLNAIIDGLEDKLIRRHP